MTPSTDPTSGPVTAFGSGSWLGVLGGSVSLLLPPGERTRGLGLWELVDGGAGAEEVLDALLASGLSTLPGFVLLERREDRARIWLRGPVAARLLAGGEEVLLEGSPEVTWVERTLAEVSSVSIRVEESAEDLVLAVTGGLVRLSWLTVPAPVARPDDRPQPVAEPVAEPAAEAPAPEPVLESESATEAQPDPATEAMPVPEPAVPAPGPDDADHDGMTRSGGLSAEEPARPGIPGQPPAPSITARPVATLLFSNGESVGVDRLVIVGRAPEARRFTPDEQPTLVTVPSPHQEISSTHLEVRPGSGVDHGSAVVTDLGSTNGTVLVQPGLPPEDLRPGIAVQLMPGAILDLGDGVTIQVTNP